MIALWLAALLLCACACLRPRVGEDGSGPMRLRVVQSTWFPLVTEQRVQTALRARRLHVFGDVVNGTALQHVALGADGSPAVAPAALPLRYAQAAVACGNELVVAGTADEGSAPVVLHLDEQGRAAGAATAAPWGDRLLGVELLCAAGRVEAIWRAQDAPNRIRWARLGAGSPSVAVETQSFAAAQAVGDDRGVMLALIDSGRAELIRLIDGSVTARAKIEETGITELSVARVGTGYIAVSVDGGTVRWQWFDGGLAPLAPAAIALAGDETTRGRVEGPRVVSDGTRAALLWTRAERSVTWARRADGRSEPIENRTLLVQWVDIATHESSAAVVLDWPVYAAAWLGDHLVIVHGGGWNEHLGAVGAPRVTVLAGS